MGLTRAAHRFHRFHRLLRADMDQIFESGGIRSPRYEYLPPETRFKRIPASLGRRRPVGSRSQAEGTRIPAGTGGCIDGRILWAEGYPLLTPGHRTIRKSSNHSLLTICEICVICGLLFIMSFHHRLTSAMAHE